MTAAAHVFAEHHCPNCRRMKPAEEFRHHRYCAECKRAYNRDRNAKIRGGTWKPKTVEERAPRRPAVVEHQPIAEVAAERPKPPPIPGANEATLRLALEAFMLEFGFTALRVTYTRLEGEISKKHRLNLAREGWIA